ncbi:uncharacterized protein [Dysidea avara]|uniref:uncharacterized protein isoform X2 n=1 Tax=Dysidea avara TaxID=196820 RepID=UPI00332D06EF
MLRFLRRANNNSISDSDSSPRQVQPATTPCGVIRKEFLVQYVGNGGPEEPLSRIQASTNVRKACSLVVDSNLLLRELTDVPLLRATGGQIEQCVHHVSGPGKLSNYVSVTIRQEDSVSLCHVFETCSVKEAKELAALIDTLQLSPVLHTVMLPTTEQKPTLANKPPSSKRSLFPLAKVKIGRRAAVKHAAVTAVTNKTRQQKIEAVIAGAEMLLKDNNRLRLLCSNSPSGKQQTEPFWMAVRSLSSHDSSQLVECLKRPGLNIESCDPEGNTLLHYATALGRTDMIRTLFKRGGNLESTCWKMFRPLHRAAANGGVTVVQTLLEMGALPNELDCYKRSPLHISASSAHYLECVHVLVEHGAKIRLADCNGIRPIDLEKALRSIQDQLISSACERFADAALKCSRSATLSSTTSSIPTHTSYTDSVSLPSAAAVVTVSSDSSQQFSSSDAGIVELLDEVVMHAATHQSKLNAGLKQSQLKRSQSFSALHHLQEYEEDQEMRSLKFKYPSAYSLNVKGIVEESAQDVERALQYLLRRAADLKDDGSQFDLSKREQSDADEIYNKEIMYTRSLTTFALATRPIGTMTSASQVTMESVSSGTVLNTESSEGAASGSTQDTTSTQMLHQAFTNLEYQETKGVSDNHPVNSGGLDETSSSQVLHRAFSDLERQIYQAREEDLDDTQENAININKDVAKDHLKAFCDSIGVPVSNDISMRTKEETNLIFENILSELHDQQVPSAKVVKKRSSEGHVKVILPVRRLSLGPTINFPELNHPEDHAVVHEATASLSTEQGEYLDNRRHSSIGTITIPYDMAEDEPGATALRQLVTLSSNEECLGRIVAHVCLPAFSSQLVKLSQWQFSSAGLLSNIAALLYNLFEVGDSTDRKKALDSGLLTVIVKLLQSRHPLPGTCLVLLGGLLMGDDDEDYLPTIIKIPVSPLLKFLESSENDSGFRGTHTTHSSMDGQHNGSFGDGKRVRSASPDNADPSRTASFSSGTVSDSDSSRSVGPSLTGQLVTQMEARSIALKLLAASSSHDKMIAELCNLNALALLVEIVTEPAQKDVINALTVLANIASRSESHSMLYQLGLQNKLKGLLQAGPSVRHQVLRLLVYTGGVLDDQHDNLFTIGEYAYAIEDHMILDETGDPPFVRGASVERLVELLTNNYRLLWEGVELSNKDKWKEVLGAISEQELLLLTVVDFCLTTYHSFMEPIIFLRLLLHRIRTFSRGRATVSSVESSSMMVLAKWLETFPDDFQDQLMQKEVNRLIAQLRKQRGPRLRHAHQLKVLLNAAKYPQNDGVMCDSEVTRIPHHDHLYPLCQRMIVLEHLPTTAEQAVYMAALQLHIENIIALNTDATSSPKKTKHTRSLTSSRVKLAVPHTYCRMKQLNKKVNAQFRKFAELSERNAKHLYIERCLEMPGYGSTFHDVKVLTSGRFRRSEYVNRLMGINEVEIIFLDKSSRRVVSRYHIGEMMGVYLEPRDGTVTLILQGTQLQLVARSPSLKELLQYPIELARQITLIDHELLCQITTKELLQKASMARISSTASANSVPVKTGIDSVATQFNRLASLTVQCVVQQHHLDSRIEMIKALILVAKNCFELRNYSAVMAIAVVGLHSVPVRRLNTTWEALPQIYMDFLNKMTVVMDSRRNYYHYRDVLKNTAAPIVPYLGVYIKDLISISEGNSDYVHGGLVNVHKRRQVYVKLMELKMMQLNKYNFKSLHHVQQILKKVQLEELSNVILTVQSSY